MAAPVLALLEKDLDDWSSAVLVKASVPLGHGAGQNTVYLVVNQRSGVYIMNEALQDPSLEGGEGWEVKMNEGYEGMGWDSGKRGVSAEMICKCLYSNCGDGSGDSIFPLTVTGHP